MVESTRVRSKRLSFSGKKTLSSFMQVNIASLRQSGKLRTSETYRATLNSFMKFMDGKDVLLSNMDAELMMGYETYLKAQGASMNTVSFYMRILRATYNRAVDKGVIRQRFPFKHVYTGVEKTVKRAISFKVIRQLKEMDLSHSQSMEFARDMFMFSFYTRGMSFVDMAFLKKTDLNNGMLTYRRKKTGQLLSIRWEKCMQDIVDKYPGNYSTYLLPIIIHIRKDERLQYKNSICLVNRRLKEIGKKLGLVHPLNEVTNNEFDVKFLRPITVKADKMDNFKDGVDVGAEGSVIDVKLAFTDWRNYAFVTTPINYYAYYGVKSITIDTDKAQTTVNGKYEPIPAGMKVEYSGVEDISAGKFGKLTYINNKAEVGEFDIKLPVAVEYAWGTVEFDIVCHVAKTVK